MGALSVGPHCIVTDLDRTLTGRDLSLDHATLDRIAALRAAGLRVVVATGRPFDSTIVASLLSHLDGMVAENGAVVYNSEARSLQIRHADFAKAAQVALGSMANAFVWGRVIGSGPRELGGSATEQLVAAGVAHAVEYNAEDCMLLPEGVDKVTGTEICLQRFGLSARDVWAIGDGENDVALLRWAALGAAPANAVPAARAAADVLISVEYSQAFLQWTEPLLAAKPVRAQ